MTSLGARRLALLAFTLVGVGIASYLTYVHYAGIDPICTTGGCEAVQASRYAVVVGIPVAVWSLATYLALLACQLAIVRGINSPLPYLWTFLLTLGSLVYSAYLTYLELAVIHAICQWCVGSAIVITALFVLALPDLPRIRQPATTP